MLDDKVDTSKVKGIYNLQLDPNEKRNLIKKSINIEKYINIINSRHSVIAEKFGRGRFYPHMLETLKQNKNDLRCLI